MCIYFSDSFRSRLHVYICISGLVENKESVENIKGWGSISRECTRWRL